MRKFLTTLSMGAALTLGAVSGAQAESMNIGFVHHGSVSNTFWQAVKNGYEDACEKIGADCQMVFVRTEGSVAEVLANMEAVLVRNPDALITSIIDNNAFDSTIAKARDAGVIVISTNVDDVDGGQGNARQAFVGQEFIGAGYTLGREMSVHFPAEGPINVLLGKSAPGQLWTEQRIGGVVKFLEEYKIANPDRKVNWKAIDTGTDLAITASRVGAYLNANPDTTAYFDAGFWHASVARLLADDGVPPGKILLGGFDLVPEILQQMKAGYVQVQIDQQPYMQGFSSVMQAYLAHTVGAAPASIDTGQGVFYPADADEIMKLSVKGLR